MELDIRYYKRCVLVMVKGRLDRPSALELKEVLCGLVEEGHENMVLELSEVDYLVSEALRTNLIACESASIKMET